MFQAIVDGMTTLINWFYQLSVAVGLPSYALAIILLTVLVKIILYPLTRAQMRSMIGLQQLQPEIRKIQEKYKDKQEAQQKVMELYKERKINPMAGCLPLLVQMPILIALYRALLDFNYVVPAHAGVGFGVTLKSIPAHEPFSVAMYMLPLLAGVTTYIQSKMTTPKTAGGQAGGAESTQKIMLTVMPVFIAWISIRFPAGLALYWVVFNVMGIIQQYFINKQLIPVAAPAEAVEEVVQVAENPGSQRKKRRGSR